MKLQDAIELNSEWTIHRFRDRTGEITKQLKLGVPIEDVKKFAGPQFLGAEVFKANVGLNEGLQNLIKVLCSIEGGGTHYGSANVTLGVGDGTAAAVATQTGLQGGSTSFGSMDTGYPARSSQQSEWRATFGTAQANHGWQEFTVVAAADDTGPNLNRKVDNKGTKVVNETWTLSLKITVS